MNLDPFFLTLISRFHSVGNSQEKLIGLLEPGRIYFSASQPTSPTSRVKDAADHLPGIVSQFSRVQEGSPVANTFWNIQFRLCSVMLKDFKSNINEFTQMDL